MEALKLQKKFPEVSRDEMFSLINRFNAISTDTPGRVDKSSVLHALQNSGESYDQARETLKSVSVDASGKVELEDWVELNVKLKSQAASSSLTTKAGKVTVKGSNANVSHTINEDERTEFTSHINLVIENDSDIGDRYPIPTNTMQLFDEVNNFSRDVCDGENYTVLLHQLQPEQCSLAPLQTSDLRARAEQVLQNADKIKCRKFLTPSSLIAGNPRLNLAFVANLFNTHPGLEPLDEQEAKDYGTVEDFDAEGEREARVFTLWLNSLNVEPGVFNLFENLKDGLIILQAFDKIMPGSVIWRRVSKPKEGAGPASYASGGLAGEGDEETEDIGVTPNQSTLSRFKAVENTNYVVDLGKQNGMHLVGIQGADIVDGRKTLVLGLVWQLMRMSITKTLSDLSSRGRPITDTEMLKWANTTAQRAKPDVRTIRSFKDPSITTGLFFLDLLDSIRPGIVDPSLIIQVSETGPYDDRRQNGEIAKLAISIARKMNALIFLVPEDIVDVRPRLVSLRNSILAAMVSHNPLFHGRWTAKRFQATVVNDIWPEVLFFTLIATMVSAVSKLTPHKLVISNTLLTVLGTVLGLVISFRTSSAYERYQEGRKLWTNIAVASKNLATLFWIYTPAKRDIPDASEEQIKLRVIMEKKTMINLIQAFSVAVKHFLRSEPGVYYQDLYPLICFLPRYANGGAPSLDDKLPLWSSSDDYEEVHKNRNITHSNPRSAADTPNHHHPQRTESLPTHSRNNSLVEDNKSQKSWFRSFKRNSNGQSRSRRNSFDPEKVLPEVDSHHPLKPPRNPPPTSLYDYIPLLRFFVWCGRVLRNKKLTEEEMEERLKRKKLDQVESNVPLEICLVLSGYTASLLQAGLLQPAISAGMVSNISILQDTLNNLERIRNTPLPFAYQAHLRMSLWLYLLFLPFQIFSFFGWWTIPGTAFTCFLLLGFLEIGQEIENPFNYDLNDLDLDHFCLSLQRDLHEVTAVCFL
ncbi:hypothetical protein C0992_009095 [Termitomyces sp. T32_za158]|nr:hypothetical protein C0992_009095 [Termitomyces sp. T32_za158]